MVGQKSVNKRHFAHSLLLRWESYAQFRAVRHELCELHGMAATEFAYDTKFWSITHSEDQYGRLIIALDDDNIAAYISLKYC